MIMYHTKILLWRFKAHGVGGKALAWVKEWLRNRRQRDIKMGKVQSGVMLQAEYRNDLC